MANDKGTNSNLAAYTIYKIIERATFTEESALHYTKCTDDIYEFIEEKLYPFLCEHMGHNIEMDHCCREEHDRCIVCRKTADELGYQRSLDTPFTWIKNET